MVAITILLFGIIGIIYCVIWTTRVEAKGDPESGFIGYRGSKEFQKVYKDKPPF
jgi:hypothetical protein